MATPGTKRRRKPSRKNRRPSRDVLTAITVSLIGIAGELVKEWIERGGRL